MQTIFSEVDYPTLNFYKEHGFNYNDSTYINIFRWLWTEKGFKPVIDSFPTPDNVATIVHIFNKHKHKTEQLYVNSYDEGVIKSIEHIKENDLL